MSRAGSNVATRLLPVLGVRPRASQMFPLPAPWLLHDLGAHFHLQTPLGAPSCPKFRAYRSGDEQGMIGFGEVQQHPLTSYLPGKVASVA